MMSLRLPMFRLVATVATQMPCRTTHAPIRTVPLAGLRIWPIDQAAWKGSKHVARNNLE